MCLGKFTLYILIFKFFERRTREILIREQEQAAEPTLIPEICSKLGIIEIRAVNMYTDSHAHVN